MQWNLDQYLDRASAFKTFLDGQEEQAVTPGGVVSGVSNVALLHFFVFFVLNLLVPIQTFKSIVMSTLLLPKLSNTILLACFVHLLRSFVRVYKTNVIFAVFQEMNSMAIVSKHGFHLGGGMHLIDISPQLLIKMGHNIGEN